MFFHRIVLNLKRFFVCACSLSIAIQPTYLSAAPAQSRLAGPSASTTGPVGVHSQMVKIRSDETVARVYGLDIGRPTGIQLASLGPEINLLVSCHEKTRTHQRIANVTAGCAAFSILSSSPVSLSIPYDTSKLPEGVDEGEIRIFKETEVASTGPMAPIDSYLDQQNKTTITTFSEQSGRFITGVLKPGERPEKAPLNLSGETLKGLRQGNPLTGVPIIAPPEANNTGDLKLSYPIDFPGVRSGFKPQISVGYSAQSGNGNIAVGWNLSVPTITVDTRWGVPIYDPKLETETYLFNGEQLVAEAGDAFVDAQAAAANVGAESSTKELDAVDRKLASLNLVPQPHRALALRPRKAGKAYFVLRRDDGLWRFVRHGDSPSEYWWEAWQENPGSDVVRVLYFGRAPGRLPGSIELPDLNPDMGVVQQMRTDVGNEVDASFLRIGPWAGLATGSAISKWGLAREKDTFGNLIDYDWVATCLKSPTAGCKHSDSLAKEESLIDRDLYLKRIQYTGHQDIEETILRCRERAGGDGCLRRQALYEINFNWTPDNQLAELPLRSDARSGGVIVPRRLLKSADIRFRRREPGAAGPKPIHLAAWQCSSPFFGYRFETKSDPLYNRPERKDDPNYRGEPGARRWLQSITKVSSKAAVSDLLSAEDAIFPPDLTNSCGRIATWPDATQITSLQTRFDYKQPALSDNGTVAFATSDGLETQLPKPEPSFTGLIGTVRGILDKAIPNLEGKGPFKASRLGTVETESFNVGLYGGIGGPIKGLSGGYKFTYSARLSHRESTLFLDVNGDGILDILALENGRWQAYLGLVDKDGRLSFAGKQDMGLPAGFRFQHEPVMESTNHGPEGHAFGSLVGLSEGKSKTVQTVQLVDMDGDGRVDVATQHGVHYNAAVVQGGAQKFGFTANSPFLLNGSGGQPSLAPIAVPVPLPDRATFPQPHEHPRYDGVRTWKAPFSGLVLVTGKASLVAADDQIEDVWGTYPPLVDGGAVKDPLPDTALPRPHRDGVIVSVERSEVSTNSVRSCSANTLALRAIDRIGTQRPTGPGEWTLIGTRLAPRELSGPARLDYRLTVSGLAALGPSADKKTWESAVLLAPAANQSAITVDLIESALSEGARKWNRDFGKTQGGDQVGELIVERLDAQGGVKLRYKGEKRDVEPLVFTLGLPAFSGAQFAALEIRNIDAQTGSVNSGQYRVDTLIAPRAVDMARSTTCSAHTDLAAVEQILGNGGVTGGMLVSVAKGDFLHFRVHSIDNGEDDTVAWAPHITYLSAEDAVLPPSSGAGARPRKLIGPGLPQSPDNWLVELAKQSGSVCLPSDFARFCDVTGRSLFRYRLADSAGRDSPGDFAPLALPNAGFLAPMTGAVEFSGKLEKPITVGIAQLEYVVIPSELLATRNATHVDGVPVIDQQSLVNSISACEPDIALVGRKIAIADKGVVQLRGGILKLVASNGTVTNEMSPAAGTYTLRSGDWEVGDPVCRTRVGRRANPALCGDLENEIDIRAGDKVCLFARSRAPSDPRDEDITAVAGFWPIDAAAFKVPFKTPIEIRYNTEFAARAANEPEGTIPVLALATEECIDPVLGDRPKFGESGEVEAPDTGDTKRVCQLGKMSRYILPRIQHGAMTNLSVGHVVQAGAGGIIRHVATRVETHSSTVFPTRISTPSGVAKPAQACTWGQATDAEGRPQFERRFAIDVRGIAPALPSGAIPLLDDPMMDPEVLARRLGDRVAKMRHRVFALRDGNVRELPVKRFATFAARPQASGLFAYDPAPLSPSALAASPSSLADGRAVELLYDPTEASPGITQVLRFVRGATGTLSVSSFVEQRKPLLGDAQSRRIDLPSTQAGFAICAAEDEEIRIESAIDDRLADGGSLKIDPIDGLLGTNSCEALKLEPSGQLHPSEQYAPGVTLQPIDRGNQHICQLGTARVAFASVMPGVGFVFDPESPDLKIAHKTILSDRLPPPTSSGRFRMSHEPLTARGIAVAGYRVDSDMAPGASRDYRDPIDACAPQNVVSVPAQDSTFAEWLRKCQQAPRNVLPAEDPTKLAVLHDQATLRRAVDNHNAPPASQPYDPATDPAARKRLYPPTVSLVPDQRFSPDDPKERLRKVVRARDAGENTTIPSAEDGAYPLSANLCMGQPVPRGPRGIAKADPAAINQVDLEQAITPLLETRALSQIADARTLALSQTQIGTDLRQCVVGPDPNIWATGEYISASRLGAKDLHFGSKFEAFSAASAESSKRSVSTLSRGVGIAAPVRRSTTDSKTRFGSIPGASVSQTEAETTTSQEVIDLNGDGFPDTIIDGAVTITDPRGGARCSSTSPWIETAFCVGQSRSVSEQFVYGLGAPRQSKLITAGSTFGFPAAKKTPDVIVASPRATFTGSTSGIVLQDKGQRAQESYFPMGLSLDGALSTGNRVKDLIDVNGDGLPDLVSQDAGRPCVHLNIGNKFEPHCKVVPTLQLMEDKSRSLGLGLSIGWAFPLNDNSFEGGLAANSATGDISRTFADVNNDGLLDIVTINSQSQVVVKLNTGWGYTADIVVGTVPTRKAATFGRSETDNISAGGAFTYSIWIPLTPLFIHINPNAGASAALTRQNVVFRDADGDGLSDFIVGDGLLQDIAAPVLSFSRDKVTVYRNRLGQHGLLERVWHPTNPSEDKGRANLEFSYSRTGKSVSDPHHRWVMSQMTIRDGVAQDDAGDVSDNSRHTCFAYGEGFYDRFERQFLGYRRVEIVEGCLPVQRPIIEMAGAASVQRNAGLRRIERQYANGNIYEAGLLLEENVFDTSRGPSVAPSRTHRQSYILVDTALSSHARIVCHSLRHSPISGADATLLALGFVRNVALTAEPKAIDQIGCRPTFPSNGASGSSTEPTFDTLPRRLTPALVQSVRETREVASGDVALISAMQLDIDHLARPRRVCDLGAVEFAAGDAKTRGAVCSDMDYDATVRPRFTHGATGGGTILVEQRNRIKEVRVVDFPDADERLSINSPFDKVADGKPSEQRLLRRRSASHEPQTGSISTLCQFADPSVAIDPCAQYEHFPSLDRRLEQAARVNVVMRAYRHDEFGNLIRFVGPIGSGGTYAAKAYAYDPELSLVETAERTEHCKINTTTANGTICLSRNKPQLGDLRSYATAIDYRHAVATATIDLNGNAIYAPLDELGRPIAANVNWAASGPACGASCANVGVKNISPPFRATYTRAASYAYQVTDPVLKSPTSTVTRHVDVNLFRTLPNQSILTKTIFDQIGTTVQTIEEAEACSKPATDKLGATCEQSHNFVASGLTKKDRLGRAISSYYPTSLLLPPDGPADPGTSKSLAAQSIVPESGRGNLVAFDGLDRPLLVTLPDGNSYDFQYRMAESLDGANKIVRHRTAMRNAVCVPSAVERDVRGAIRAVIESSNLVAVEGIATAAEGSNAAGQLPGVDGTPSPARLVESISQPAGAHQQVYACNPARGTPFELAANRSVAAYDRDALGQLVAVRLPRRTPTGTEQTDAILAAYDALGRRVLVDDPDRGFERIAMDGPGNPVCTYSGTRRKGLQEADRPRLAYDDIIANSCPDPKAARGAATATNPDRDITRLTKAEFLVNLPVRTSFKLFGQSKIETDLTKKRIVSIEYGAANDNNRLTNRVGRPFKTADMVGEEERTYDALGRPVETKRTFGALNEFALQDGKPLALITKDSFDLWGLHKSRTLDISVPGKAISGKPKPADAKISETIAYRYTPAGQLAEIIAQSLPPPAPPPTPGAAPAPPVAVPPAVTIASGMQYDARGNLLGMDYATGVLTRHAYDEQSNRLLAQRARMGVAGSYTPQIYFQNLDYRYDPTGNVLAYNNKPIIAEPCAIPSPGTGCSTDIPSFAAKKHGLLISSSANTFAYDQLNRIRSTTKSLTSLYAPKLDKDGEPQVLDDVEIGKASKLTLDFAETFAFRPTHEMALLKRAETRGVEVVQPPRRGSPVAPVIKKATTTFTSTYSPDGRPRHAPGTVETRYKEAGLQEKTKFGFDEFGRMGASLCARSDKKGCWPDRYFDWNADDSLRSQIVEIPSDRLTEAKKSGPNKGIIYYDHVRSEYDASGRRTYKKLTEQRIRKVGGKSKIVAEPFVSDTLYADAQLTITRQEGQQPQAIMHYFAGPQRVASKWVGDDRLFTYHAQMQTRNVTDIVVGIPGKPETARLNGQQEYAAFGQVLHERETLLAGNKDGVTSHAVPGLPRYRFNAKEQDETGLQDFGARFYDNRLALWLRPDPVLHDYLGGKLNGGVFASKNLASYGFGWGNPVGYTDPTGRSPLAASGEAKQYNPVVSVGISGTAAIGLLLVGPGVMISGGVGVDFNVDTGAVSFKLQGTAGLGIGSYLGAGLTGGVSNVEQSKPSDSINRLGYSRDSSSTNELGLNAGFGESVGLNANWSEKEYGFSPSTLFNFVQELSPKSLGVGLGAHSYVGKQGSIGFSISPSVIKDRILKTHDQLMDPYNNKPLEIWGD